MPGSVIAALTAIVGRHSPANSEWLAAQLHRCAAGHATDRTQFAVAFSGAGRRLGTSPIGRDDADRVGIAWPATAGVDECGRGALVLAAVAQLPGTGQADPGDDEQVTVVRDLLRRGEIRERQAVLRVLAALPGPGRFVASAVDACRTNVQTVFEAIACDNDFPAQQFPVLAFDQLVLKALFIGAPVGRIVGLAARITPELVRMVDAFASERRAAGRAVPADVELVRTHDRRSP